MQKKFNDNVVASADKSGVAINTHTTTIGLPKADAIKYAQQGIVKTSEVGLRDGFVEHEGNYYLVHGDVRVAFTEGETQPIIDLIKAAY